MTDEEMLRYIHGSMGRRADATDYLKELQQPDIPSRLETMNAGAAYDIQPQDYGEGEEPPYPGVTPQPPRPATTRDRYVDDIGRVNDNRKADPYEDRGIFNFKLDDIRDALKWGEGDEVGDDAMFSLNESENPFKGQASRVMDRLKGMNPEMDDFEFIKQMRRRLGMETPNKLYTMIDEDRAFREANPGRGGMFRLDETKGDPYRDPQAYPQQRGRARRGSIFEE